MSIQKTEYTYCHEIETILEQFVSILDRVIIKRYSVVKNKEDGKTIKREPIPDSFIRPRYVFGTRQRILTNLVNKAKNFTLPAIAVDITSISAPNAYRSPLNQVIVESTDKNNIYSYKMPVQIELSLKVDIVTKYITDLYQIVGCICTTFKPYVYYSWAVPAEDGVKPYEELRNKITFDGSVNITKNDQLKESDEDKFNASLTFKVEGYLFDSKKSDLSGIIIDIGTSYITTNELKSRIEYDINMPLVSEFIKNEKGNEYDSCKEIANAHPRILTCWLSTKINSNSLYFYATQDRLKNIKKSNILLDGYNFSNVKCMIVPLNEISEKIIKSNKNIEKKKIEYDENANLFPKRGTITKKNNVIEGYVIPIEILSKNKVYISINTLNLSGIYDIIIYDEHDYDSISDLMDCDLNINTL